MSHAGVSETRPAITPVKLINVTGKEMFTGWCQPALICGRRQALMSDLLLQLLIIRVLTHKWGLLLLQRGGQPAEGGFLKLRQKWLPREQ